MAHAKDAHYWTQLRSALTGGQWTVPSPAKTPHGAPLSWSELLRKFNKHCRGFADVAEIASQTQALALLLLANSQDEDSDDTGGAGCGHLALGDECVLAEERVDEARTCYETLKSMECFNFDTLNFALAYYAYALGMPSECLSHISKIPDLPDVQSHIPSFSATRSKLLALQVAGGASEASSSSRVASFASDSLAPIAEIRDGKAWAMTETIRTLCLQGMSHEKLSPTDPKIALKSYRIALPLLTIAESEISAALPSTLTPHPASGTGKLDSSSFTRFRELWRWAERLIWRAVILTARTSSIHDDKGETLWTWLSHYALCSAHWPATFRTRHRSTISVLHLHALVLCAKSSPSLSSSFRSTLRPQEPTKPPDWVQTARSVVQEYRAILTVSTHFPRAGEQNVEVEDFVDLCIAVWEASGEVGDYAGWVIDILWWATRLTFNSHRILRHMTRLLYVSGDTELAKRTLRLYVQIVGKAQISGGDSDSDRHWIETLVQGARMLCRFAVATTGLEGIRDAREAGMLIEKARERLDKNDKELAASVDLAEGIWSWALAIKEQEPRTRPERLSHSHALFLRSIETFPTPPGYYHLSLSFARAGPLQDLDQAITYLQLALESEPGEIRYWHVLGLFLTAMEQWKAATGALEQGAGIGEMGTVEEVAENIVEHGLQGNGFPAQDSAGASSASHDRDPLESDLNGQKPQKALFILDTDTDAISPSESLLRPLLDHPLPLRQEVFEHALQLRMTQVAVAEHVEGPEGAMDRWVEVFSWIAEKRGVEHHRSTMTRPSLGDLKAPSELVLSPQPVAAGQSAAPEPPAIDHHTTSTPVPPIHVTPATPNGQIQRNSIRPSIEKLSTIDEKLSPLMEKDTSKGKKVQQMLKNRVHKGHARISTISKKIGHGVARTGSLRRSNSAPDFHSVLRSRNYQASSIHSRRRLGSLINTDDIRSSMESPPPPPPVTPHAAQQMTKGNSRRAREDRLFSDLWLMSAATFRRSGKIEQAKGAIQEAEVRDEDNPAVWVQLGLYYVALGHTHHAIDAFHKALFIAPDDVSATVHLCRLYLSPSPPSQNQPNQRSETGIDPDNVDLAAGLLSYLATGAGHDVAEVWYFLAKSYGLQGRKDRERECLSTALTLSERRGVRDIGVAVGWFL